jgi:hypothetical protein
MNRALLLDRSLVSQIYVASKHPGPGSKALLEGVAGIVERYGLVYFEPRAGVSLMEGVLFGMAMLRNKLSVVADDAVALLPDERPMLLASREAYGKDPMIRQALHQYNADRQAVTRSDSKVLDYVIRLLLLGRSLKADIYPWSARLALVLAIFGSAQSPAERTRLGDSVDLMTFTCRGFPYAAPIASATELVSFGVIAQQAAAVTASSGAEDRTADDDARSDDAVGGNIGRGLRNIIVKELVMGSQYTNYGQAGAMGECASGTINNFQEAWKQASASIDLDTLAEELETLRKTARAKADTAEEDQAVAAVGAAALQAKKGNGAGTLERLAAAGAWVLDIAKDLGVKLAVEALSKSLGLK